MPEQGSNKAIRTWVPGIPQPGGSKKGFAIPDKKRPGKYRAILTEDNRKSKPWREAVIWAAKENFSEPIPGPIEVSLKFFIPRPKNHFGKYGVRPGAPALPIVKPDVTKLVRSTEDALKGIAWIDDSQVVDQRARKVYGHRPGLLITIMPAAPEDQGQKDADEKIVRQLGMRFLGMGG